VLNRAGQKKHFGLRGGGVFLRGLTVPGWSPGPKEDERVIFNKKKKGKEKEETIKIFLESYLRTRKYDRPATAKGREAR